MPHLLNTPAWPQHLADSIHCLHESADRARVAYQGADAAAEQLRLDAADAEELSDGPRAAQVVYEGYARIQYASVLGEIAFSHAGLALGLSRVWHRAAYAFAYGVSAALSDLQRHERPQLAHVTYHQPVPAPPSGSSDALRAAFRAACDAHLAISPGMQPYGRQPWAASAQEWHTFAEFAEEKLLPFLASGR
ncbi:hypothetical protein [Streptomyces sp. NBC_01304]|uniref:hypothetical protein n=1 Tax=Streptomyces sp. NBC_01304 TaxID=2903818 RepID=UPI002E14FF6A|nr:hypothetical protein OG430_48945 [Streptomyces sp. NBC_01304]